ncbi:MAG: glycosyltransferase family 39 protein [Flavobacteriales bacterium]|nr:glycosyltransferase family 39 protein [Flavobacteriales bacterium]
MLSAKLKLLFTDIYFLITLVICIAVYLFKYQDLFVPYFGDELWAYGPAVRKMGQQIPSLLPNALSVEDHWGHPLLFFFLGGIWGTLFGTGIFSTHVFASLISITFIIAFYLIIKRLFNSMMAFYSTLIVTTQSIFLGQFTLVLPEILLTLLMFITLYHYVMQQRAKYILFASCLVLVKETGVLLIAAITIWDVLKTIVYEKENPIQWKHLKNWLLLSLPLVFLLFHMLLLKYFFGWFMVPERVRAFDWEWDSYYRRIRRAFHYIFVNQGRRPVILVLFVITTLFLKNYTWWKRLLLMALIFACYKIFFNYWKMPDWVVMTTIPLLFFYFIKIIFLDQYKEDKRKGSFVAATSVFIVIYVLFSSSQFDSLRYLFCSIPFAVFLPVYFIRHNLKTLSNYLLPLFAAGCIFFSMSYMHTDTNFGDDTLNYREISWAKQDAIRFLESNNYYAASIRAPFLFSHALTRPEAGYLSNMPFLHVNETNNTTDENSTRLLIIDRSENGHTNAMDKRGYEQIYQYQDRDIVWIEIYKHNK